jgi:hypothetical protein
MVQTRSGKVKSLTELPVPTRNAVPRTLTVHGALGRFWLNHTSFKRITRDRRVLASAWPVDPRKDRGDLLRAIRFLLFAQKGLPQPAVESVLRTSNLTDHRCGNLVGEQHGIDR